MANKMIGLKSYTKSIENSFLVEEKILAPGGKVIASAKFNPADSQSMLAAGQTLSAQLKKAGYSWSDVDDQDAWHK